MLQQGADVNACDYDGRSGLMLAASKGFSACVTQLLAAGAAANAQDVMGGCALLEAVKAGHDDVMQCASPLLLLCCCMTQRMCHVCLRAADLHYSALSSLQHDDDIPCARAGCCCKLVQHCSCLRCRWPR
jgi:hypothetical protein